MFRLLWISTLFSTGATQMTQLAQPWLAYDMTGSAVILGLVAGARGVPQLVFALYGGVTADRIQKRLLIFGTQIGLGMLALLTAILVHTGLVEIWHLVAISLGQGVLQAFNNPARHAYIPELVGDRGLANAIAIHAVGLNLTRIAAPALAGLLLAWSPIAAFYFIGILYVGAMSSILRLPEGAPASLSGQSALRDAVDGVSYLWHHGTLRLLMWAALIISLVGIPYRHLLPVFQVEILAVGPSELGMMYSAVGLGALASSLAIAGLSHSSRLGAVQVLSGVAFGLGLMGLAATSSYALALMSLFFIGLTSQSYMTVNQVMIMAASDRSMYGRMASMRMMIRSVMPVAVLGLGFLIDNLGAPFVLAGQGLVLILAVVVLAMRNPSHWQRNRVEHGDL